MSEAEQEPGGEATAARSAAAPGQGTLEVGSGLRLLVLARNYPNNVLPRLGLWTQRLVHCVTGFADVKVVAPVPYAPPLPAAGGLAQYTRFRRIDRRWFDGPVEVFHPRWLTGPGYSLHNVEALTYAVAVFPIVRRLQRRFRFDLIHAHFTYPDGLVGCLLGRRYQVPVVITEHAPWLPWLQQYPLVRHQAIWAAKSCAGHLAVSEAVRRSICEMTGRPSKVQVIPNAVDGTVFRPLQGQRRVMGQILFVGAARYCKGVDVLIKALPELRQRHPEARLLLAGDAYYRSYRREAESLKRLAEALGVAPCIDVLGGKTPAEVAELMAQSAAVVLPSRAESFGAVLIEAMACGTPVVATRCGGPDEVVTPTAGHLVPPEDPGALAAALAAVLEHPEHYDPEALRRQALERYGFPVVAQRLATHYAAVLGRRTVRPQGEW